MKLNGKQWAALFLATLLALIASWRLNETYFAIKYWWEVGHASPDEYIVHHWATLYTWASALFAPLWLVLTCGTLYFFRHRHSWAVALLATYVIVAPLSCTYAPSLYEYSGGFFDLEELPFADSERAADFRQLMQVDERLKRWGDDKGEFPRTSDALRDAVGDVANARSPYERDGKTISFDLEFESGQGLPYSTMPQKSGVVYYSVNASGTQFVLTISGLNRPVSNKPVMMKAGAFVGSKQPWGGLLATEESLREQ